MYLVFWLIFSAQSSFALDDVCLKHKNSLEKEARETLLKSIKTAAVETITRHYQKNKLTPVKHIDVIPQGTEAVLFKVNAGKDSVGLKVKLKEKIKVTLWPSEKKEVDALGRPLEAGQTCIARAYSFSTDREKLFLDIENAQSGAVITGFSVVNLAEVKKNVK